MAVNIKDALSTALTDELIPSERQLLPDLNDIYEPLIDTIHEPHYPHMFLLLRSHQLDV